MNRSYNKALSVAALAMVGVSSAMAQADWGFWCIDPGNNQPRSIDHSVAAIGNLIFRCHVGQAGTITYGGPNGPCYAPGAVTGNLRGRIGFMMGDLGSVQDQNPADPANAGFTDDFMVLTMGMPFDPSGTYGYACSTKNGARTLFGANAFSLSFVGASDRYMLHETTNDGIFVSLRVDLIADAARLDWVFVNLEDQVNNVGLWFGEDIAMLSDGSDLNGVFASGNGVGPLGKPVFALVPSMRPPVVEQRINRIADPGSYPDHTDFFFGQTASFGMRVDLGPTPGTLDASGNSDATQTDELVLGNKGFVTGGAGADGTFADNIIGDVTWRDNAAFLMKYPETPLAANPNPVASRLASANAPAARKQIITYVRTPWGVGNYATPYAAVVDAPILVAADPNGQNGLSPNPMTIRVYVDNTGSYSSATFGTSLNDVKVTLNLPNGITFAPGEVATKTISVIGPRQMLFVDYSVEADGVALGDLPYTVTIDPSGTPPTKTLSGIIRVSATPKIAIHQDANLVSPAWLFQDTAWNSIFAPLQAPADFQVYAWDPVQNGYVVSTSFQRGQSVWIVSNSELGAVPLNGASSPPDAATGAPLINIKPGWNLIGNPYNYAIQVSQLLGRTASSSLPWSDMLSQNVISGSLIWFDANVGDYQYLQGLDAYLEPNKGYWIYAFEEFDLDFSAVNAPGLPQSSRSANKSSKWEQTDKQWRLKLTARTNSSIDAENYVGIAKTAKDATNLSMREAPMAPTQKLSLAVEQSVNGQATRMAQALVDGKSKREWKVIVNAKEAGDVTLTWPNVSTLPKNVRFRITDLGTGSTRDLKGASAYTFNMSAPGTREFKVEALAAGSTNAVIGNVVVTGGGRGTNQPITINYTLSTDSNTTVRILSGRGREVYTVSRGRADRAGENSATWTLRDNANRLVAPGSYRVEILAETENGERVRKVIPINVIR